MGKIIFQNDIHVHSQNNVWYTSNLDRFIWKLIVIYRDGIYYTHEKCINHIEIRKFIENELYGDTLITDKKLTKKVRNPKWNDTGLGNMDYFLFSFDEESDFLAFKLRFYDIVISESDLTEISNSYIND